MKYTSVTQLIHYDMGCTTYFGYISILQSNCADDNSKIAQIGLQSLSSLLHFQPMVDDMIEKICSDFI